MESVTVPPQEGFSRSLLKSKQTSHQISEQKTFIPLFVDVRKEHHETDSVDVTVYRDGHFTQVIINSVQKEYQKKPS